MPACYVTVAATLGEPWALSKADYAVFHSPYNKLVQKSMGRSVSSCLLHAELANLLALL